MGSQVLSWAVAPGSLRVPEDRLCTLRSGHSAWAAYRRGAAPASNHPLDTNCSNVPTSTGWPPKRTTEQIWQAHVDEQERSSLTVRESAHQQGLNGDTLSWWRSESRRGRTQRTMMIPPEVLDGDPVCAPARLERRSAAVWCRILHTTSTPPTTVPCRALRARAGQAALPGGQGGAATKGCRGAGGCEAGCASPPWTRLAGPCGRPAGARTGPHPQELRLCASTVVSTRGVWWIHREYIPHPDDRQNRTTA